MSPPDDESCPFMVRFYSVNAASPLQVERYASLGTALDRGRDLAALTEVRTAEVIDDRGMRYAEFSMLWSVPVEYQ